MARVLGRFGALSLGLGAGGFVVSQSIYNVDGGHCAVIWHRLHGVEEGRVIGEGTHLRIPLLEYPTTFDVRLRPRAMSTRTGTKDLQTVQVSLRVLSRPIKESLPKLFKELGEDWDERVLPSLMTEVLKATVAQYDAEQLLASREKVSRQIREALNDRAAAFGVKLDDVSITHLVFSADFSQAIEAKQVAQQEAERSKFQVQKAEQEKKAAIIKAEGESTAAELISQALKSGGNAAIEVKRIDAAREIADALAGSRNVVYLPSGMNMMMAMPAAKASAPAPMQ